MTLSMALNEGVALVGSERDEFFEDNFFFFDLRIFIKDYSQQEDQETLKSKDTQFAVIKPPKCLERPHNSTKNNRKQYRNINISRDDHNIRTTRNQTPPANTSSIHSS